MKNRKYHAAILGVPEDAGANQVRQAYRRQARRLHPDKNSAPKAKEAFQQLNESYLFLLRNEPEHRAPPRPQPSEPPRRPKLRQASFYTTSPYTSFPKKSTSRPRELRSLYLRGLGVAGIFFLCLVLFPLLSQPR